MLPSPLTLVNVPEVDGFAEATQVRVICGEYGVVVVVVVGG